MTSAFTPRPEMLRIQDLHAYYGESHILHGINLKVARGECVTLLGRNGAGRSTTLKAILGLVGTRTGSIMFNGNETTRMQPHTIARLGIGFCPEERGIFAGLTTEENLMLAPVVASGGRLSDTQLGDTRRPWAISPGAKPSSSCPASRRNRSQVLRMGAARG